MKDAFDSVPPGVPPKAEERSRKECPELELPDILFGKRSMRLVALLWLAVLLSLAGAFFGLGYGRNQISTNILDLLPADSRPQLIRSAIDRVADDSSRRITFLAGSAHADEAINAGKYLARRLRDSGLFSEVTFEVDPHSVQGFQNLYTPYVGAILPRSAQRAVAIGRGDQLIASAKAKYYSPFGGALQNPSEDPLLFLPDLALDFSRATGQVETGSGYLTVADGQNTFAVVTALTKEVVFSRSALDKIQSGMTPILSDFRDKFSSMELLKSGAYWFAEESSRQAKRDIAIIGTVSTVATVFFVIGAFQSLAALFVSLTALFVGLGGAIAVSMMCFSSVHIITLAFGSSLIGVCCDFGMHFFSEQFYGERKEGSLVLRDIFAGITLGMFTSIIAYAGLFLNPFPGLHQIALFSIVGIFFTYMTVVCWFPLFKVRREPRTCFLFDGSKILRQFAERALHPKIAAFLIVLMLLAGIPGLYQLTTRDDIRTLQSVPPRLAAEEASVRKLTGVNASGQFILITASSDEEVLQKEERVLEMLTLHEPVRAISRFVPSEDLQRRNARMLKRTLTKYSDPFDSFFKLLGIEKSAQARFLERLENPQILTVEEWLLSEFSKPFRSLWLGNVGNDRASVVFPEERIDASQFKKVEQSIPGVYGVDRVGDITFLLRTYREKATFLALACYAFILVLFLGRYGLAKGVSVMIPPIVATIVALAFMGWMEVPLNLFSSLALLIVLGLGIDYACFFAEAGSRRNTTMLAIFLSSVSTMISFAALARSHAPFLQSFGIPLTIGIMVSMLLSPLVTSRRENT